MTDPSQAFTGFSDPALAAGFRDFMEEQTADVVNSLKPGLQSGMVLRVYRDGPVFPVDPNGQDLFGGFMPPEGPGNPEQLFFADVRLDTGDIVRARCGSEIPFCRTAVFYDPENPASSVPEYFVGQDGIYHQAMLDANNIPVPNPDVWFGTPSVAPRVMVEGIAPAYRIVEVMRGMVKLENPVLDAPYMVNGNKSFIYDEERTTESFIPVGDEYSTQGEGHIGCFATAGYIEVTYTSQGAGSAKWVLPGYYTSDGWELVRPIWQDVNYHYAHTGYDPDEPVLSVWAKTASDDQQSLSPRNWIYFHVGHRTESGIIDYESFNPRGTTVVIHSVGGPLTKLTADRPQEGVMLAPPAGVLTTRYNQADLRDATGEVDGARGYRPSPIAAIDSLKRTMNGGGLITVSTGGNFKWTSRFMFMTSRSTYQGAAYYEVSMPPVGTQIPVVGPTTTELTSFVTVTSAGIPLSTWGGLYYRLPVESVTAASDPSNFIIVQRFGFFNIPDTWVLVAFRNADSNTADIVLGNGREIDSWKNMGSNNGYTLHPTFPAQYRLEAGIVYIRGGYRNASTTATLANPNGPDGALPVNYRPDRTVVTAVAFAPNSGTGNQIFRADITAAGDITFRLDIPPLGQIFLDGIYFHAGA